MRQIISPNIIPRHITAESDPVIYLLLLGAPYLLHAHQSRPTCEGVLLPPGLSLRVLIHVPRDT
jgi:hypothetical protein